MLTPGGERLCDWCWVKRTTADSMSKRQPSGQRLLLEETGWGAEFLKWLPEADAHRWRNSQLPETTDDLAAGSQPGNYLGFLYADGNSMGKHFQGCSTGGEYRRLSTLVSRSLHLALWLALNHHFRDLTGDTIPFEVIALGGDDLILLCTADRVLPLAVTVSKLFTRISARLENVDSIDEESVRVAGQAALATLAESFDETDHLTLSCAAVIAHPKQPILNIEEQARGLLSSAKRAYPGQSAIDFHIVSSSVLRDVAAVRREEYQLDDQTRLTARPLLRHEMETLQTHVSRIKGGGEGSALPRTRLNALYQSLFAGREAASFETFFLYYRLAQAQRSRLDALFDAFAIATPPTAQGPGMPWGERLRNGKPDGTFTVLADLAELYEFVPASFDETDGQEAATREEEIHANPQP
jgi:CRISPR-associated protein Cmr2